VRSVDGAVSGWHCFAPDVHRGEPTERSTSPSWLVTPEAVVGAENAVDTTGPSLDGEKGGAARRMSRDPDRTAARGATGRTNNPAPCQWNRVAVLDTGPRIPPSSDRNGVRSRVNEHRCLCPLLLALVPPVRRSRYKKNPKKPQKNSFLPCRSCDPRLYSCSLILPCPGGRLAGTGGRS